MAGILSKLLQKFHKKKSRRGKRGTRGSEKLFREGSEPSPARDAEVLSRHERQGRRSKMRRQRRKKIPKSIPVRRHYFRRFFYTFCVFFVLFGLLGILWFVYESDPNAFGQAEKYYREGLSYHEQGDLKSAKDCYEKCLEVSTSYSAARVQLAKVYQAQAEYDRAEALLQEGLRLQPRYEDYYRQMIYLYTAQNRIAEALDYLENISATYLLIKINGERPAAISASPMPGTFESAVDIVLNIPEGSTVYYTTDGSLPDKNSSVYTAGDVIRLEKGSLNIRALALDEKGLPGVEFDVSYRVYNERTEYVFKDKKIEQLVRMVLGRNTGKIFYRDLDDITVIDGVAGASVGIKGSVTTLEDLLEFPNLTTVILNGERSVTSWEPLLRLPKLKSLTLDNCRLTDANLTQLSALTGLSTLSVAENSLTTLIPLASLTSLTSLNASGNQIRTVPSLLGMTSLRTLKLSANGLTSLSFIEGHNSLTSLDVSDNLISDLAPIASCASLSELNVASNLFSSLAPLIGCTRMQTLNISDNDIAVLSDLQNMALLTNLFAANTKITTVSPLTGKRLLSTLDVSGTAVRDFSPLAGCPLKNLSAANCEISNITTIVYLNDLEMLDVAGNYLTDIGVFALMNRLNILNISGNYIADFTPLVNCIGLRSVNAVGSKMTEDVFQRLTTKGVSVIQ